MNSPIKKILISFLILLLILILGFGALFGYLIKKPAGTSDTKVVFEIVDRTSTYEIAKQLKSKDLINSDWAFALYSKLTKKTLLAGSYLLSENMSIVDITSKISSGDTAIRKITIPEGWRDEQIAQYLSNNKYIDYADFMAAADGYDGKLFPDTYFISVKSTAADIVKLMNDDYVDRTKELNITSEDLVLASIIEREAKNDSDRSIIAGVYKNRLAINMKMQADPTVQYSSDSINIKKSNVDISDYKFWQSPSTLNYSSINSPYNTYLFAGLPPTPICNPGIKSIEAALNPDKSNFYYFLHDSDGNIHPSSTSAEHERLKSLYIK